MSKNDVPERRREPVYVVLVGVGSQLTFSMRLRILMRTFSSVLRLRMGLQREQVIYCLRSPASELSRQSTAPQAWPSTRALPPVRR